MGSPASVVIAQIVMQNIERQINDKTTEFLFWYRFVDDVLTCILYDKHDPSLNTINSINDNIQFTSEIEKNSHISFLYLDIKRSPAGILKCRIYRKDTHTNKYLSYDSYHPVSHKESVINSLLHRTHTLCDEAFRNEVIQIINSALTMNGYPKPKLKKMNKMIVTKMTAKQINNVSDDEFTAAPSSDDNKKFVSAPLRRTFERVACILSNYYISLCHKPAKTLR